ncbi:MAG: threonylcarbamoyl-AMP synthase [Magnetococcales bacterium]|nr:threonylcarbamoyl-AMP synthase [Magnetococcales bacterium]
MVLRPDQIREAVKVLESGGIMAHPTETLFGLAVDPDNQEALERLTQLKGRSANKGFILLVPNRAILTNYVPPECLLAPTVQALLDAFWPGPLTLVLPALPTVSDLLTGGRSTLAVRHSPSPLVESLLADWGGALVSTSANRSNTPALSNPDQIAALFGKALGCVVSGAVDADALPSTLVKVGADGAVELLRPGAVPMATIQSVVDGVVSRC